MNITKTITLSEPEIKEAIAQFLKEMRSINIAGEEDLIVFLTPEQDVVEFDISARIIIDE